MNVHTVETKNTGGLTQLKGQLDNLSMEELTKKAYNIYKDDKAEDNFHNYVPTGKSEAVGSYCKVYLIATQNDVYFSVEVPNHATTAWEVGVVFGTTGGVTDKERTRIYNETANSLLKLNEELLGEYTIMLHAGTYVILKNKG